MKRITSSFFIISALLIVFSCGNSSLFNSHNKNHVIELRAEPIDTVRIAFIGVGQRGLQAVERLAQIDGVELVVIADLVQENLDSAQRILAKYELPKADEYDGPDDWKVICEREDIHLIYICTPWELHTPISVYAMENGKHVATEVPAAQTIKEAWQLVKTAEKTRMHCIQLENCIYDFFELSVHHMVDQGMFGEIKHAEGAYIHDLRWKLFDDTAKGYWNMWRLRKLMQTDGNTYPTHGIGPIAHILDIHRGDRMTYVSSLSTKQFQLSEYADENLDSTSEFSGVEFKKGDLNTSLIMTENGKTLIVQHDVVSPRPYSRLFTLSGTKGFAQKYPQKSIAFSPNSHYAIAKKKMDSLLNANLHPIAKEIADKARKVGGHGGMDYIMDYRLIYCLRNGLPLDMDVYDAAEWSALIELSKKSAAQNGKRLKMPDFTRGAYKQASPIRYYLLED
ncbi:MAG: acetylgalactosaminidase [Flavobacteriales bacterium]|nr:acetylgalactosaminidase [Flavobacteriales bacterium]